MITTSIYSNGDDCFLAWIMPFEAKCLGFAIYRELKKQGPNGKITKGFLHNRTGFEGDNNPPNSHESSEKWPFQRYTWTDHSVDEGDTVSYIIYPVYKTENGHETDMNLGSKAGPVTITTSGEGKSSAYFNRGMVLSQFMTRALIKMFGENWEKGDLIKLKNSLKKDDSSLRKFLMGQLGDKIAELLKMAKEKKWHVYAMLYELEDDMLVAALKTLGKKAHIVLSNGSKKKIGEDGNKDAADELGKSVDLSRRMLWSEGLGHNKYLVFAKTPNEPFMIWTGSTNWATTGLCTQLNNGILIEDKSLATVYKKQWKLLKDDKRTGKRGRKDMHFGEALTNSNNEMKSGTSTAIGKWNVWFTRTSERQDMQYVTELINSANDAILFLMFEPGDNGLLQVIQSRLSPASKYYNEKLYIHGVVNSLKKASFGKKVDVELVGRGANKPFELKVVEPEGAEDLAGWANEVMRDDFIMGKGGVIGHAIIHSKVIIIDPLTNPVVITGSHNYSNTASSKNDENMLIIKGNKSLAERYCVNIMSSYQHYRWRSYLKECKEKNISPWQGLKKSDEWQNKKIERNEELKFWVR
jgi:hypothetical protein